MNDASRCRELPVAGHRRRLRRWLSSMIPGRRSGAGAAVLVVLGCMPWFATAALGGNIPMDTDGNGLADYVQVTDWDGDGTLETADIQAAIAALDDPGPKLVEIGPGNFAPPVTASGVGILSLPSNLTLAGAGQGITIINGFPSSDQTSIEPVVANDDHVSGNVNITVRDLEIDGGWDFTGHNSGAWWRMGVMLAGCENCLVERLTVRDTWHSCLYSKDGRDVTFRDNNLYRCGNATGTGIKYPCVYLYSGPGRIQEDVWVTNNLCDGGSVGLNTRRQDSAAVLRNVHFSDNTVRNTRTGGDFVGGCIVIAGLSQSSFTNTVCTNTGATFVVSASSYQSGGTDASASSDILVDGLQMIDPEKHGVQVLSHLENSTFRNVSVQNTGQNYDCLGIDLPLRNVVFDEVQLTNCGQRGIGEFATREGPPTLDENVTFSNVTINGVDSVNRSDSLDWPGVGFNSALRGLVLDNVSITDASGEGVLLRDRVVDSTLRDVTVSAVEGSGILIGGGSDNLLLDRVIVDDVLGHGLALAPRQDGVSPDHRQLTVRDSIFRNVGSSGVAFDDMSTVAQDTVLIGNLVDGAGFEGMRLALSGVEPSDGFEVNSNLVRDFGRSAPGSAEAVGIQVSGLVSPIGLVANTLEDVADQAQFGIVHDIVPLPSDLDYLCTNNCAGFLPLTDCMSITGASSTPFLTDTDGDLARDGCDNCVLTPNPAQLDTDDDSVGDVCDDDDDNDGTPDKIDNCPLTHGASQVDTDSDGMGDICDSDDDNDGVPDLDDGCPLDANPSQLDSDLDLLDDACDNCTDDYNPTQADRDDDGEGDRCDTDDGEIYVVTPAASRVAWQPEAGFLKWNVYVGDIGALRDSGVYTQQPGSNPLATRKCGQITTEFDSLPIVPPGEVAFVLVTGRTSTAESSLGTNSSGDERENANPCL